MDSTRSFLSRLSSLVSVLALSGLCALSGQAGYQLDLSGHTYSAEASATPVNQELSIPSLGAQAGFQYWFRLKSRRMEFIPGFHLGTEIARRKGAQTYDLTGIQAALLFPVLIYPLSFKDDCNCPTFRKQGTVLKKGLHFIVQPGLSASKRNLSHDGISTSQQTITAAAGIGAGLDLGLSRTLTLTPFLLYQIHFSDRLQTAPEQTTGVRHRSVQLGLRMRIQQAKSRY